MKDTPSHLACSVILRHTRGSYKLTHWLPSPHHICHMFPLLPPHLQDPQRHCLQGHWHYWAVSVLLSLCSQSLTPLGSTSEGYPRPHCPLHPAFPAPPSRPLPPAPTVGLPYSPWPSPTPWLQAAPFPLSFPRLGDPPRLLWVHFCLPGLALALEPWLHSWELDPYSHQETRMDKVCSHCCFPLNLNHDQEGRGGNAEERETRNHRNRTPFSVVFPILSGA